MIKPYHSITKYKDEEDFKRLDFIIEALSGLDKATSKVLEIGCGNGNISLAIGSLGYNIKGIDIDIDSIANANASNTFPNATFEVFDANLFTITDEYDAIVCSEVLEHLINPAELVESIFSILKPNGVFVATVPNGWGPREVLVTKPMQWLHSNKLDKPFLVLKKILGYQASTAQSANADLTHIKFFTSGSLKKLMTTNGFKLKKFNNADFIERLFPYSLLTRRIKLLQKLDCAVADYLPHFLTSGFYTTWYKP